MKQYIDRDEQSCALSPDWVVGYYHLELDGPRFLNQVLGHYFPPSTLYHYLQHKTLWRFMDSVKKPVLIIILFLLLFYYKLPQLLSCYFYKSCRLYRQFLQCTYFYLSNVEQKYCVWNMAFSAISERYVWIISAMKLLK